jgi:glutathione S-transferase
MTTREALSSLLLTLDQAPPMITIHNLNSSRSERIIWLMEELALPYELVQYSRTAQGGAAPELLKLHPLGKAPIISDDDLVLAESGAIVEYIVARYGDGRLSVPPSSPDFASYVYWFHYAEGSLMSTLLRELMLTRVLPDAEASPAMARARTVTHHHLQLIDAHLAASDYFAGDALTAADIMMVFAFTTLKQWMPIDLSAHDHLNAYLARIAARPAYVKAMALFGPAWKAA